MKKLPSLAFAALIRAAALTVYATSDANAQPLPQGESRTLPQEAIEACKGLVEKEGCQFNDRNYDLVSGVCAKPPSNTEAITLACRPEREQQNTPHAKDHKTS